MAKRSFSAYQINLEWFEKIEGKADKLRDEWDTTILEALIKEIKNMNYQEKQIKFFNKALLMEEAFKVVSENDFEDEKNKSDLSEEDATEAIVGKMMFVEHGTIPDYWDVMEYKSRKSEKKKTEGEEKFFHFIIRLNDGFMLLQNDVMFTRSKMDDYLSELFQNKIPGELKGKYHDIVISNLLKRGFFEELNELDSVSQVVMEVRKEKEEIVGDENEFVKSQQEESEKLGGTHVQVVHKAKRSSFQKGKVVTYLKGYKGDKNITSIKVKGNQGDAEKTVDVKKYREKYTGDFDTDPITNLVKSKDVNEFHNPQPVQGKGFRTSKRKYLPKSCIMVVD